MDHLTEHLQAMLGPGAMFRDGQREAGGLQRAGLPVRAGGCERA